MNIKEDSQQVSEQSTKQSSDATPTWISDSSSGQTTNYPNRPQSAAQTGQIASVSYFPSAAPIPNGSLNWVGRYYGSGLTLDPGTYVNRIEYPATTALQASEGYPDNNPKTAVGAKKLPLEVVPPSAMAALAEAFQNGAEKYGSYNWRTKTVSSSVYYAAALRHLQAWWDGENVADDSGIHHLHHAMACLAILVDAGSIGKLNDNRPPAGAAGKMQQDWTQSGGLSG